MHVLSNQYMGMCYVLGVLLMLCSVSCRCCCRRRRSGWYSAPDKMFILVMLIQNSVPTGARMSAVIAAGTLSVRLF